MADGSVFTNLKGILAAANAVLDHENFDGDKVYKARLTKPLAEMLLTTEVNHGNRRIKRRNLAKLRHALQHQYIASENNIRVVVGKDGGVTLDDGQHRCSVAAELDLDLPCYLTVGKKSIRGKSGGTVQSWNREEEMGKFGVARARELSRVFTTVTEVATPAIGDLTSLQEAELTLAMPGFIAATSQTPQARHFPAVVEAAAYFVYLMGGDHIQFSTEVSSGECSSRTTLMLRDSITQLAFRKLKSGKAAALKRNESARRTAQKYALYFALQFCEYKTPGKNHTSVKWTDIRAAVISAIKENSKDGRRFLEVVDEVLNPGTHPGVRTKINELIQRQ